MKNKIVLLVFLLFFYLIDFAQNNADSVFTETNKLIQKSTFNDSLNTFLTLNSLEFNKGMILTPLELIKGKIPGLSISSKSGIPGSSIKIIDKGVFSFSSNNNLLIIVDNVPVNDNYMHLNPNDIKSISFIDDPSIARKFGSQSSNGVILITTNRGIGKFHVNYKNNFAVSYLPKKTDVLSSAEFKALINERFADNPEVLSLPLNYNTNWQDEIYKTALGQDHYLSLSGSLKKTPYSISIGKTDMDGILCSSNYNRSTTNISLEPSLFKNHLKIYLNLRGTFNKNRIANEDAIYNAIHYDPTRPVYAFGDYSTYYDNSLAPENPLALLDYTKTISETEAWNKNIRLDYKFHFLPDLRLILNYGKVSYTEDVTTIRDSSLVSIRYPSNEEITTKNDYTVHNFIFDYSKYIKAIESSIEFVIGNSRQLIEKENSYSSINELYLHSETTRSSSVQNKTSFFSQLQINVLRKYALNAMYSLDGDSRFSEDNKWFNAKALSLAWNIIKEDFLKSNSILSGLMLQFRYSQVAGKEVNSSNTYSYMPTFVVGDQNEMYSFEDHSFYTIKPMSYDLNIRPETITDYAITLSLGLYNRINGNIKFYNKETSDLLIEVPVAIGSNFSEKLITNAGRIENSGIEIYLNSLIFNKTYFKWNFGVNFNYNKNKIQDINTYDKLNYKGINVGDIGHGNTIQILTPAYPAYSFYVYEQVYDENEEPIEGLYVDRNEDGLLNEADKYHYEKVNPNIILGISSNLKYKNWEVSFSGRANFGNYVYNNIDSWASYDQVYRDAYLMNISNSVNKTEFETAQLYSDYFVENASYFKMDYIRLAYNFENIVKGRLDLLLSLIAQNVFVITNYSGQDPEVVNGIDNYNYPRPRIFSISLNLDL